ncbi:hypothetical protein [Streptomyces sp. NPDC057199]|uniref:hypothetical protein n=1 Tax=Streptomyces sp. NPDC057199 TaxID=3346047 RepID=UPI0036383601
MAKTLTIADAEQELTKATGTLTALKAKILDKGPGSVTAEELGEAVHAVEHAKLTVEHAGQQAQAEADRQRQQHLAELKAEILDQAGDVDTALDAMQQIETAAAVLIAACAGRQRNITQWTAALRQAGVPRYEAGGKIRTHADGRTYGPATELTDEHAGMGWSDAGMGRSDAVHVDGRRLAHLSPGLVIAAALERAARTAGYGVRYLHPAIEVHSTDRAAIDNPEAWLRTRY